MSFLQISIAALTGFMSAFPLLLQAKGNSTPRHTTQSIRTVPGEYPTIQTAIDSAETGDTILVSPGLYVENISFLGKSIAVASLFLVTSEPVYIDSTIIDGGDSSCVVRFENEEDSLAVLCGFTIQNGLQSFGGGIDVQENARPLLKDLIVRSNTARSFGGGIYCTWYSSPQIINVQVIGNLANDGGGIASAHLAQPRIRNCIINRNEAAHLGGGILIGHGDGGGYLQNVLIEENIAQYGGGIAIEAASEVELQDLTIIRNQAESSGGGIYCSLSNPHLNNCLIQQNVVAEGSGGGLSLNFNSQPIIERSRFIANRSYSGGALDCYNGSCPQLYRTVVALNSANFGGGIYASVYSVVSLINATFINNQADSAGASAYLMDSSRVRAVNTILWDSAQAAVCFDPEFEPDEIYLAFCDVLGGMEAIEDQDNGSVVWGEGNIEMDPQFNAEIPATFELRPNSPCIDAGTAFWILGEDTLVNLSPENWRGEAPDMGAREFGMSSLTNKPSTPSAAAILISNYPEPFNRTTNIQISGLSVGLFSLNVYNVQGRNLGSYKLWNSSSNITHLLWPADQLSTGCYWLGVEQNQTCRTAKITLVK